MTFERPFNINDLARARRAANLLIWQGIKESNPICAALETGVSPSHSSPIIFPDHDMVSNYDVYAYS